MSGCSDSLYSSILSVFFEPFSSALMDVSSEKQIVSGAMLLTIWRYAESVYPAIGARHTIGFSKLAHENFFMWVFYPRGRKISRFKKTASGMNRQIASSRLP